MLSPSLATSTASRSVCPDRRLLRRVVRWYPHPQRRSGRPVAGDRRVVDRLQPEAHRGAFGGCRIRPHGGRPPHPGEAGAMLRARPDEVPGRIRAFRAGPPARGAARVAGRQGAGGGTPPRSRGRQTRSARGQLVVAERELDPGALRALALAVRDRLRSGAVVLGSRHNGKGALVAAVTADLIASGVSAADLAAGRGQAAGWRWEPRPRAVAGGGGLTVRGSPRRSKPRATPPDEHWSRETYATAEPWASWPVDGADTRTRLGPPDRCRPVRPSTNHRPTARRDRRCRLRPPAQ